MIKLLSVAIFTGLFFASNQQFEGVTFLPVDQDYLVRECWTDWFDRDNPSGSGDFENLPSLRIENPGKICPKPVNIEAQTLTGLSAAEAGDVIFKNDTTAGFTCRNQDQPNKICDDYRVRFLCSPPYCARNVCWTKWFDRDNLSGTGVRELLDNLRKENPGQICENPLSFKPVATDTNIPSTSTGDIIYMSTPTKRFVCRKKDQKSGQCRDYKVRFRCPCSTAITAMENKRQRSDLIT